MIRKSYIRFLNRIAPIIPRVNGMHISKRYIGRLLPRHPVVVDCGAHNGADSIEMASLWGATVHAIEAVPSLYSALLSRTRRNKTITCYNHALADYNGEAQLFLSAGASDGSSSLLEPMEHLVDHPDVTFETTTRVACLTLDQWASEYKIRSVDLLWLDMQGYEFPVLERSQEILPTVKLIHCEVSVKDTYRGVKRRDELCALLDSRGFEEHLVAIPEGYDMGNILFVRRGWI